MADIDVTPLQKRMASLIGQVTILAQDVATLRQRVEETAAETEMRFENMDRELSMLRAEIGMIRGEMDAGFRSVLEGIARIVGEKPSPPPADDGGPAF